MNPDLSSPEYQQMQAERARVNYVHFLRQRELHDKAVKRRRKAKRGGKR